MNQPAPLLAAFGSVTNDSQAFQLWQWTKCRNCARQSVGPEMSTWHEKLFVKPNPLVQYVTELTRFSTTSAHKFVSVWCRSVCCYWEICEKHRYREWLQNWYTRGNYKHRTSLSNVTMFQLASEQFRSTLWKQSRYRLRGTMRTKEKNNKTSRDLSAGDQQNIAHILTTLSS